MELDEFIHKEGQKVISQLEEHQSMDALKEFLHQKNVIISAEEAEGLNQLLIQKKNGKTLSDDQLDSINGGGFYSLITNCPNGHTKYVLWVGRGVGRIDDNCVGCEYLKKSDGKYGATSYCDNVSSEWIWE